MDEKKGIVLYSIDYKEKSKIIYLYTKYGIKSYLVTNASNQKGHNLAIANTLNVVSFIATENNLPKIKEYDVLVNSFDVANDLKKIDLSILIIKILKNIKVENNILNEKYLDFVINIIEQLKIDNINVKKLEAIFLIKSLIMFGVEPNLKDCVVCHNKDIMYFSFMLGGAVCKNCYKENDHYTEFILKDYINIYYVKDLNSIKLFSNIDNLLANVYKYYIEHCNINLK